MQSPPNSEILEAFERGRSEWHGVRLSLQTFAERASELKVRPEDLSERASDLFLAWACAAGDAKALTHFERVYLPNIDRYVQRMGLAADALDELRQQLRIRLLTGSEPRIGLYGGRGPLGAWVRVTAIRIALNNLEQAAPKKTVDIDALGALVSDKLSPELSTIKQNYRGSYQAALERSLSSLEARDKTLLRMHFVDQLNIDAIGRIYRVHRATVARWLVNIRQQVFANIRSELSLEIPATSSEFRSMLAVIRDDLSLSLQRLLGAASGQPAASHDPNRPSPPDESHR